MPMKCTLKNGKFYVVYVLPQLKKRILITIKNNRTYY